MVNVPVEVISFISVYRVYTVKRLDIDCTISLVYDFELEPMGPLDALAWDHYRW